MSKPNQYPPEQMPLYYQVDSRKQIVTPYYQDPSLFDKLIQEQIRPIRMVTINLGVAGELPILESGYHFVQYGHDNAPRKNVNTTALVNVQINTAGQNKQYDQYPAKHARGFSGPFNGLYLSWPAQTDGGGQPVWCDFIIFKSFQAPWIDGEAGT